jgi:site-specific DNA-cytosine methylase
MRVREFHLFAGIGGGIYGGHLLGHTCCGAVEIDDFCQSILSLRQEDGWMNKFPMYDDITELSGKPFQGAFDVLCGGFPCQAFSHAARGRNIAEKNLWGEMYRFVKESDAPIVFAENVTEKAINKAADDLNEIGYSVRVCKLSCSDIGADHQRNRFWLLAVKDFSVFKKVSEHTRFLPKFNTKCWSESPFSKPCKEDEKARRKQLKAIGNAQSPLVAASAFRILVNRHLMDSNSGISVTPNEICEIVEIAPTWIKRTYGEGKGLVHTPTTMANYSCPSMMKHSGCRNYNEIFGRPISRDAEYLMGFPIGASNTKRNDLSGFEEWVRSAFDTEHIYSDAI